MRRAILRCGALAAFEVGLRLVPILPAIGGKAAREQLAQLAPLGAELAGPAHRLVDADRLGLAGDGDQVELARLDDLLRQPKRLLAYYDRGAIDLVDALEARGEVHGVADHRIRACRRRADGPDHGLAGGDAHTDHKFWRIAPHPGDLGQLRAQRDHRFLLREGREAGVAGVVIAGRERGDPERHYGVADIFVDDAVMLVDHRRDRAEIAVEQVDDGAGGELLADVAEAP